MENKKAWYAQKTTWVGIATIVASVGGFLTGNMNPQESMYGTLGGFMAIFMRQGIENIKK